jgi:hypothetical protein
VTGRVDTLRMDGFLGLVGAAVGAAIAICGQLVTTRTERRSRVAELLLEQCAQAVALEEDFRDRLWEERRLGHAGRVDAWNAGAKGLADARLRLLSRDERLLSAARELGESGTALAGYWRSGQRESDEIDRLWKRHRLAVDTFIEVSGGMIRDRVRA